jgi:hypothetical protein
MDEKSVTVSVRSLFTKIGFVGFGFIPIAIKHRIDKKQPLQAFCTDLSFPIEARKKIFELFDAYSVNAKKAQCCIPQCEVNNFYNWLQEQFNLNLNSDSSVIDWDPFPKLEKCLTTSHWKGVKPILRKHEFDHITLTSPRLVMQPISDQNTEVNFFLKWNILTEDLFVYNKLGTCPEIIPLVYESLKSTCGGTCQGRYGSHVLASELGVGC